MSGLAYVPKEQGILLTVRKNPGLQPDTASYYAQTNGKLSIEEIQNLVQEKEGKLERYRQKIQIK